MRVGATVRRPTGAWTPGVHALLRHLESKGFGGAPRALGTDDEGREILTYVEGTWSGPTGSSSSSGDAALAAIARLIRAYHDAVADFDHSGYEWSDRGNDPDGPPEILCHNDLAPWNLIATESGWTFIDWDLAAPGRRAWDLGWALLSFVPLTPAFEARPRARPRHRIDVFSRSVRLGCSARRHRRGRPRTCGDRGRDDPRPRRARVSRRSIGCSPTVITRPGRRSRSTIARYLAG